MEDKIQEEKIETKFCKGCGTDHSISEFEKRNDTGKLRGFCKKCISNQRKEYRKNNFEKIKENHKIWENNNKEKIKENKKNYYQNNKQIMNKKSAMYYQENKEKVDNINKIWIENNIERVKENRSNYYKKNYEKLRGQQADYYKENKKELRKKANEREKILIKTDPSFKLRKLVSRKVCSAIKKMGFSKNNESIKKYLPYTFEELKIHLEKQFEPWMNWSNHGIYNIKTWDDNNQATWTWQLDHLTPQSDLPYTSMEDENFKKCWSLENLRPLSAKQNWLDGVNRTRHNKEIIKCNQ